MLDLDKAGIPNPYVERLFEGFAFSMGRLRAKIDAVSYTPLDVYKRQHSG